METGVASNQVVRCQSFELNLRTRELYKNGQKLKLQGQPIDVLAMLLEKPGELVTREQLRNRLWPETTFVDFEHGLNSTINRLRDALGDHAESSPYIETLPRLGYRFIIGRQDVPKEAPAPPDEVPLAIMKDPPNEPTVPTFTEMPQENAVAAIQDSFLMRRAWLFLTSTSILIFLVLSFLYLHRSVPPQITDIVQITHDNSRKWLAGTDGARFYFGRWGAPPYTAEVAISGGEVAAIPIGLPPPGPWVIDVSPDGSSLLVYSPNSIGGGLWSVQIPGGSLHHLTDGYGQFVMNAAWSPDGKSVVHSKPTGGLFVVRSDGSNARKLGSVNEVVGDLAWSPDGTLIRFTMRNRIWEISLDGSGLHELLPSWRPTSWQHSGHWTPDGTYFEFSVWDSPLSGYPNDPPYQLWILDEHRRGLGRTRPKPIQLTSGPIRWDRPYPSKDGTKILDRGVILRGELVGYEENLHELAPYLGGISAEFLAFSRDAQHVLYVTFPEGILWRANRDGSSPIQLTSPPLYPMVPHWSPDGTQILFFASDTEGHSKAYVMPSLGGPPRSLLPDQKDQQSDPDWSPDGSRIVFANAQGGNQASRHDIRVLDLMSHKIVVLPESEFMRSPRWSPDGRFIAALFGEHDGLKVFDLHTNRWSVLQMQQERIQFNAEFPTWSRDSRFIYFLDFGNDPGVYRIRLSGGRSERIVSLKGFANRGVLGFWMGLDPEDAPLLLRDTGIDDIYALALETK